VSDDLFDEIDASKVIGRTVSGVGKIDVSAGTPKGILVINYAGRHFIIYKNIDKTSMLVFVNKVLSIANI
jgi:phosphoglycerate dehydrogenase-like enzyme